jgi:hypothetical protein
LTSRNFQSFAAKLTGKPGRPLLRTNPAGCPKEVRFHDDTPGHAPERIRMSYSPRPYPQLEGA